MNYKQNQHRLTICNLIVDWLHLSICQTKVYNLKDKSRCNLIVSRKSDSRIANVCLSISLSDIITPQPLRT